MERAAASTEETDIDAVELPLPGADILDFSRGVTDLDAVAKEVGATPSPGSLPSTCRHWHGPSPTTPMCIPRARGLGGIVQLLDQRHLPAADQRHLLLQGCPLARAQGTPGESCAGSALCSHMERVRGRAHRDFFTPKPQKYKTFLIQWKFPWEASAFSGIFYKSIWDVVETEKVLFSKVVSTPSKVYISFECSCLFSGFFGRPKLSCAWWLSEVSARGSHLQHWCFAELPPP